jgi:hypothetical protein
VDLTGTFDAEAQFDTLAKPGTLPLLTGSNDVFAARLDPVRPPIGETVIDGHILQLTGDAGQITITDDRNWGIMVATDGDTPLLYGPGIDKVIVTTGDRNDIVQYLIGDSDLRPADLEVHLGSGIDTLLVDASAGWSNAPSGEPWRIDVTGAEHSTFRFGGSMGNLDLEDQLGRKQNTVDVMIAGYTPGSYLPAALKMDFLGTGGNDSIHAMMDGHAGGVQVPAVDLEFSTGADPNPSLSVAYQNVTISESQKLAMTGMPRDATFDTTFRNVVVDAPVAVSFGTGRDDPGSTSAIIIEWMGGPLDGTLGMTSTSGPLRDDIRVIYDFNPVPEPPGGKPSDLHGDVVFSDPDEIRFEFIPTAPVS